MAVIFSYGIDTMVLPENIMSYSNQIGRTPSKYFQWYNIENPSDYHFPFTDSAEDGEGWFDFFHWFGENVSTVGSSDNSKSIVQKNRSSIKKKEEFWEDVSMYVENWEKGIPSNSKLSNYLNHSDYNKWNIKRDDDIPQKMQKIKNNRDNVVFNDYKSNNIYFWSGNDSEGVLFYICVYSFVDNPKVSNYKVPDLITLTTKYRSQPLYYVDNCWFYR